jgi:CheY-like chemotaxis protein
VELRVAREADQRLRFTVLDTGPGVPSAQRARIFELFQQAGTGREEARGFGLGLAISQRLVRLMGGEIEVADAPGGGSRFSFAIPLAAVSRPRTPAGTAGTLPSGYEGERRRVLVVDDEEPNRDYLADLLQPLGFEVECVADGAAALAGVARSAPHLVLLDLQLPGLSGLEVARALRRGESGATVGIIAVSASVFPEDRQEAIDAGCDAFVPKPIDAVALCELMGEQLALVWRRPVGTGPSPALDLPDQPPPDWPLPTAATLAGLAELVEMGDVVALRSRLQELRAGSDVADPFMEALARLAGEARLAALRTWLAEARRRRSEGTES